MTSNRMTAQEAIDDLTRQLRQVEEVVLNTRAAVIVLTGMLAARLIRADLATSDGLVEDIEQAAHAGANDGNPNRTLLDVADLLRPIGRGLYGIEGGKPDDDSPDAA